MASAPRWKVALARALKDNETSNVYQLASVDSSSTAPHVRSVVHRAFLEPKSPATPLLITTTDVRTPKVAQITLAPTVELAWWIAGTQEQYRVSGRAAVLPAPTHPLASSFPAVRLGPAGFDWEGQRKQLFGNLSGHMRATWARPVPGSPMPGGGGYEEAKNWPTTLPKPGDAKGENERTLVEEAFRNFALVVIEPEEVDYVELAMVPNQRTKFTRDGEEWRELIVVP